MLFATASKAGPTALLLLLPGRKIFVCVSGVSYFDFYPLSVSKIHLFGVVTEDTCPRRVTQKCQSWRIIGDNWPVSYSLQDPHLFDPTLFLLLTGSDRALLGIRIAGVCKYKEGCCNTCAAVNDDLASPLDSSEIWYVCTYMVH